MQEFWSSFKLSDLITTMKETGDVNLQQLSELD
jgi:hypothetical protein